MRVDIEAFLSRYDRPPPPEEIRQLPLDGDDGHYARLCALDGARPTDRDFGDYADDIAYMPEVQADLFAHLIPACLQTWRHDQLNRFATDYTGAAEVFTGALARRPLLDQCLTPDRAEAVREFMRDTLLDRIDQEDSLSQPPSDFVMFSWILGLGTYAVIFDDLESLWRTWWRFESPGQAIAALQYVSCLMYDDDANPILAPPSPKQRRRLVPAQLWHTDSQIREEVWKFENVMFLVDTVTPEYVRDGLERAARALQGRLRSPVPARMIAEFKLRQPLLEGRLRALPEILSTSMNVTYEWPPNP